MFVRLLQQEYCDLSVFQDELGKRVVAPVSAGELPKMYLAALLSQLTEIGQHIAVFHVRRDLAAHGLEHLFREAGLDLRRAVLDERIVVVRLDRLRFHPAHSGLTPALQSWP